MPGIFWGRGFKRPAFRCVFFGVKEGSYIVEFLSFRGRVGGERGWRIGRRKEEKDAMLKKSGNSGWFSARCIYILKIHFWDTYVQMGIPMPPPSRLELRSLVIMDAKRILLFVLINEGGGAGGEGVEERNLVNNYKWARVSVWTWMKASGPLFVYIYVVLQRSHQNIFSSWL